MSHSQATAVTARAEVASRETTGAAAVGGTRMLGVSAPSLSRELISMRGSAATVRAAAEGWEGLLLLLLRRAMRLPVQSTLWGLGGLETLSLLSSFDDSISRIRPKNPGFLSGGCA